MSNARLILLDTRVFVFWTDLDRTKNTLKEGVFNVPKHYILYPPFHELVFYVTTAVILGGRIYAYSCWGLKEQESSFLACS